MIIPALLALCLPAAALTQGSAALTQGSAALTQGSAAQVVRPAHSPTFEALKVEAAKDPAAAGAAERAKTEGATGFTGENPIPFHVQVLSPVELIDPAAPPRERKPEAPQAPKPEPVPTDGDQRPTYHFEGKKPMGGLTIYTPVRDQAGRDNSTRASGGGLLGMLKGLLKWAAVIGGAALMIWGGPVGLVAGGALVAYGAYQFLKKRDD